MRIEEICKEKNITYKQLAEKANMLPEAISRLASGKTNPTLSTISSIASALGVTVPELFEKADGDFKCPNCGAPINISVELAKQKE